MRLTEDKVKEIVIDFVRRKYPDAKVSFEKIEFKERFYEYWVDAFIRAESQSPLCLFCRVEAGTGRITHQSISQY